MSSSSVELEIPPSSGRRLPVTPQGQSFVKKPHNGPTPHGIHEDADDNESDKIRAKVAQTMNTETLLCPIGDFLRDYGPVDVAPSEVAACKRFLLRRGILINVAGYRWREFVMDPSAMKGGEIKIFDYLRPIVDGILEYADASQRGRGNDYNFKMVPNANTHSDIPGANHKMDASLLERDYTSDKLPVRFCIVPNEYKTKRNHKDQKEVREQTVGDCQHIMCEDPRRMFIFAVSIEDTRMSVWYFSRSHSMKALSFDWVKKDIDTFIHVFLAFAYATPKELGVDPLVHKAPIANPRAKLGTEDAAQHYIYECPIAADPDAADPAARLPRTKYFQTIESLNDQRPYCISGRMTRIWKVIEVDSVRPANPVGTEPVVLKDVWLDHDRATEAENTDNIFNAIEKLIADSKETWKDDWLARLMSEDKRFTCFDEATKQQLQRLLSDGNYKTLFLTKLHAWKGEVSKPLSHAALKSPAGVKIFPEEDFTGNPGVDTRVASTKVASRVNSGKPVKGLKGGNDKPKVKMSRHYTAKQQSRFVYKEVCSQLHEVGTLGAFMDVILQATEALLILYCAGWVHRDISSGNLLAFNDNGSWKVKLSDLEFSEQLSHARHRADPRTGTPFFMPLEIISQEHLIDTIRGEWDPNMGLAEQLHLLEDTKSALYRRFSVFKKIPDGRRVTSVPVTATSNIPKYGDIVRYNFQHDLEAIWWVVLYFITACVPYQKSRDHAKLLFSKTFEVNKYRTDAFYHSFAAKVAPCLHPTIAEAFTIPMERLRVYLIEQYIAREVFGQTDVLESYSTIHNDFESIFRDLLDSENDDWKETLIVPSRALTGAISAVIVTLKRGRDSDDDDDDDEPADYLNKRARNDDL